MTIRKEAPIKNNNDNATGNVADPNQLITQEIAAKIEANMGLKKTQQDLEATQSILNGKTAELSEITAQVQSLQQELNEAKENAKKLSESMDANASSNQELIATMQQTLEQKNTELETVQAEKTQLTESVDTLKTELDNTSERLEKLEGLINLKGNNTDSTSNKPLENGTKQGTLEVLGVGSEASRRFESILKNAPTMSVLNGSTQKFETIKDTQESDRFWALNKREISEGINGFMKSQGYFQGGRITQDITLPADIPHIAFQHLSSMIRMNTYADLILDQFALTNVQLGIQPGRGAKNFSFPRYTQIARPTTKASRTLTTGTAINAATQNIAEKSVATEILELGLGVDASNAPIGLTSFVTAFSMIDLESIIMANLGMDYQATKNLFLQEELFLADVALYNDANAATATVGDLAASSNGTLTGEFLTSVYTYLRTAQVPAAPDGCYFLITHPTGLQQLLNSKSEKERYISPEQMDLVGTYLAKNRSQYGGMVDGYKGKFYGFHVFEQNVFGVGVDGDAGVQNETINAVSTATRTSFAMGVNTIGWATALPVEIRVGEINDFNRSKRMIWYSHENSVSLDVKTTAGTDEQMRVVELRTIDTAI